VMTSGASSTVLHVVERPTLLTGDFDAAVEKAGLQVERTETVYGAMARLVRQAGRPVAAVVVCLDGLEAAELEFFTLAARLAPATPLYIYGRSTNLQRQQRAISLGAESEVSADRLAALLSTLEKNHSTRVSPPRVAASVESIEAVPVSEDGRVAAAEKAARGRDRMPSAVPTPWRPAANRPRRIPPGRGPLAGPNLSLTEPLLSRQEVDALLGKPVVPDDTGPSADDVLL
jgi:hypothetical protein